MPSTTTKPRREKKGKAEGFGQARRRYCSFCKEKIEEVDFKNHTTLRRMMSDKGKIRSRRITGTCRRHQNQLAAAVKFSREMALIPYVNR
jgi:small subunit ribosomal protein S18